MGEIITSEKFLMQGLKFPPAISNKRLMNYELNSRRYKGTYNNNKKLSIMTPEGPITSNLKVLPINYFRLDTDKQRQLIFSEKPVIHCDGIDDSELKAILDNADFFNKLNQAYTTYSSLADAPIWVSSATTISCFNPKYYFEIVEDFDTETTKCIVLYQPIYKEYLQGDIIKSEIYRIRIIKHYKGYYTEQVFKYNKKGIIGQPVKHQIGSYTIPQAGHKVETGLDDFAISVLKAGRLSGEVYGTSMYEKYADLVLAIEKRLTLEDAVIDKHSEPTFVVPNSLIRTNEETGEQEFLGVGGIVGVPIGSERPEYLTWDGKTDAAEKMIETLKKELVIALEYGETYLNNSFAANMSGEALKTLLKGALDKAGRIVDEIEVPVKKVIRNLLSFNGYKVEMSDISIEWQDGISESDLNKAQVIQLRVSTGTMSKKRALMIYDGLSAEKADEEIEQIEIETNMNVVKEEQLNERINSKVDEVFGFGESE